MLTRELHTAPSHRAGVDIDAGRSLLSPAAASARRDFLGLEHGISIVNSGLANQIHIRSTKVVLLAFY